jgi:hypothetical protein
MERLKILIIVNILYFTMVSCKTQNNVKCDAYGRVKIIEVPFIDTIITEPIHFHSEETHICYWEPKDTNVYYDTLYIEVNYVR